MIVKRVIVGVAAFAVILAAAGLASAANGWGRVLSGPVPAKVERVIDGDTLEVRARIWLDQELIVRVRLASIDAPELRRPRCLAERRRAEAAKAFLEDHLTDQIVILTNIHYGKYAGRIIADVRLAAEDERAGKDVAAALLAADLARPRQASDPAPKFCTLDG